MSHRVTDYRTHPEYRALLAAVCASPGDDLPRLVMADLLTENGEAEYGDFIRVQCELARLTLCGGGDVISKDHCPVCQMVVALRRRERELWNALGREQIATGLPDNYPMSCRDDFVTYEGRMALYRRGFVAEVHCTLADWCGGELCWCCDRDPETYGDVCPRWCGGTQLAPGIGPRLVREHPVERVVCSDRQPWEDGTNDVWSWFHVSSPTPGDVHPQSDLPAAVYGLLGGESGRRRDDPGVTWKDFPTREAANLALSAALIRWAKSQGVVDE